MSKMCTTGGEVMVGFEIGQVAVREERVEEEEIRKVVLRRYPPDR
jgi:hypothetical protein